MQRNQSFAVAVVDVEPESQGGGDGDRADIYAAEDAVALEMTLAEARGELERADQNSRKGGKSVRNQQQAVLDDPGAVRIIGVYDERVVGEDEH